MRTYRLYLLFLLCALLAVPHAFASASCPRTYEVLGADADEQEILARLDGDLRAIPRLSAGDADDRNRALLKTLRDLKQGDRRVAGRDAAWSKARIRDFFRKLTRNPQVKDSACGRYKDSKKVGFCFGRAAAAHVTALESGLQKESIRKIWLVGDLDNGSKWKFHVATLLRGEDGDWYAVDPYFDEPLRVDHWYEKIREDVDPEGTARLFSTEPSRLYVSSFKKYNHADMDRDSLGGFFQDLFEGLRRERENPRRGSEVPWWMWWMAPVVAPR